MFKDEDENYMIFIRDEEGKLRPIPDAKNKEVFYTKKECLDKIKWLLFNQKAPQEKIVLLKKIPFFLEVKISGDKEDEEYGKRILEN